MSEYRYTANIELPEITSNVLLNRAFKFNLNSPYDSYKCDDYEIILDGNMAFVHCDDYNIILDGNMAFVHFKELCIPFIRHTMDTMACALNTEYNWNVRDKLENKDIEEIYTENDFIEMSQENFMLIHNKIKEEIEEAKREKKENNVTVVCDSDYESEKEDSKEENEKEQKYEEYNDDDDLEEMPYEEFMRIHNKIKEEIEEAKREAEEKKKKEREINKAADIVYQNQFDYCISCNMHVKQAEFIATINKDMHLFAYLDTTSKKISKLIKIFNYIRSNVFVLAAYDEENNICFIKFLTTLINKIYKLKEESKTNASITKEDYINFNQTLDKSLVEVERAFTFISKKSAGEEIQFEEVEKILKQIEDNKKKKEEESVPKKRIVKKVVARET